LQDRLPKEMRLAGISDIAGANEWLPGFVASFNRRFEVIPKGAVDAHIAYPGGAEELANILSVQTAKTLGALKNQVQHYRGDNVAWEKTTSS